MTRLLKARVLLIVLTAGLLAPAATDHANEIGKSTQPLYLDSNKSIDERVEDLLSRMTVEEKVYQMAGLHVRRRLDLLNQKGEFSSQKANRLMGKGVGFLAVFWRSSPPREGAEFANEIQKFARESTRLRIPIVIHEEALHGLVAQGSTSFPQSIALASTWDEELMGRVSVAIGKEMVSRGVRQCLSPTINIARDPRCGRTEETYGEDPYLAARMAVAFVKGIQSQGGVATPKHFVANFVGDGGRDSHEVHFSERILREIYLPAFRACVEEAGALSIMSAYNALDGIPCSSNKWLLTDVLRKEWGFKGFVVSDYASVWHLRSKHRVAETQAEAAKKAAEAGLDVELPSKQCYGELIRLARTKQISLEVINESVRRILRVKFLLGLFEDPFVDPEYAEKISDCQEHRQLALEAAQKSIVLLKNEGNVLPLTKNIMSIAVIGPNANVARLGGYSGFGIEVVTPLEGISRKVSERTRVRFAEGCDIQGHSFEGFKDAVAAAQESDVVVLVVGNSRKTEGESRDRSTLDLPGVQEDLILEIHKVGKPLIVVLINGSAITMQRWGDKVQAVVEAWYPGEEGGNAIADVLFGDYNPAGRLPITFPKTTGQLPLYYNHKPSGRGEDYADLRGEQPLFPFGYGLSYTKFKYSSLDIKPRTIGRNGNVTISVVVENTGEREGDEVVQLYLRDVYSSMTRPVKELKRFKRITLKPGGKERLEFRLAEEDLSFLDRDMGYVVEPGTFMVAVGGSSAKSLEGTFSVK